MKTDIQRKRGQFYTPTLFVDYAHDMISKEFGEDWKEKYVVWDNSAGSKNLTRDYYFNELYSSTLEQAELDISKHYNKEAVSFQFDFLNDPLTKLPNGLLAAFEQNKPIIFFMNPPYASASNLKGGEKGKGKGATATMISEEMVANKLGNASNNLYAQFIYRIMLIKHQYNLTNCHIAMFCKPLFLSGSAFKSFRNVYLKDFKYNNGILFQASEFADVSANWGINFTIWNCGETDNKDTFNHTLVSNIDGEIVEDKTIEIYNLDNLASGKNWIKEPIKGIKVVEKPTLSSGLTVKVGPNTKTKIAENAMGCYYNVANDVLHNSTFVTLYSSADSSNANGLSILPENLERVMAMFASRKLVECVWYNADRQYLAPNMEHPKYQEFINDSIVYSLFSAFSQQSSLRNIDYKGKKWDIKNEFFFMSKEEMLGLSEEFSNDDCYNDARVSKERYVYELLEGIELSEEAQAVLDKAREIVRKTFKYRKLFNEEHENYQINNWDASYYQMKPLWKEYAKEDFEEFKVLYKKLADKMRPMVYELGFLKR